MYYNYTGNVTVYWKFLKVHNFGKCLPEEILNFEAPIYF